MAPFLFGKFSLTRKEGGGTVTSEKGKMSRNLERETRVLLEEVRSDFKALAEQYISIDVKLKEHDQKFVKIEQKLEQHDLQFLKIDHRFDRLEQQFGGILKDHEHRLKTLESK